MSPFEILFLVLIFVLTAGRIIWQMNMIEYKDCIIESYTNIDEIHNDVVRVYTEIIDKLNQDVECQLKTIQALKKKVRR